jgi:hypothetical protein
MESFTHAGLTFRTKLLDAGQAQRFAKALTANVRFTEVTVETSPRAKGERRFFVKYLPARIERQEAMLERQQSAREERARTQQFTFVKDADHPFWHCLSHASGQVYEVTEHSCSCEDQTWRCGPAGLKCKHQLSLRFAILAEQRIEVF